MIDLKQKLWDKYLLSGDNEIKDRYEHSLSVAKKAVELCEIHKLDIDKKQMEIAGIIHDYAKFSTMDEYFNIVKEFDLDSGILDTNFKVLHAILGPYIIKKELNIDNENILNAIMTHTTGKPNMNLFSEVLFVADFTEDLREGVEEIRKVSLIDLKKAVAMILDFKLNKAIDSNQKLHSETFRAYDYYKIYLDNDISKVNKVVKAMDHNLIFNTIAYNMKKNTPLFDYMIITTALSAQQMLAAVNYIKQEFDVKGIEEGDAWCLVDLYDVIVQIFLSDEREKYSLDKLLKDVSSIRYN